MVPADKAANNVDVVCRLHYVNTLKQGLDGTRAYLETETDEVSVVNAHLNDLPVKFSVCVNEGQNKLMSGFRCQFCKGSLMKVHYPKLYNMAHLLALNVLLLPKDLYRQIVGIPMGTNCAPLVADLFLYCYERDFMDSLNHDNQADVIEAFNSTSRYLDDLLNIDNPYFEGMVNQIYPPELQLNKANISDTEAPFLDLHLSVANGFVSSKIYDKRDDFDFDIVNFPFLDGDVPRRASYGVYISQLIRFARVCNHVTDFNARNKCLTAKLLQQGYRYHKLRKTFSKFYRRHYELISKYNVGLKALLSEGLSEPEFYGDLVYKLKKLKGINDFSLQFGKIITRYRRIGYNLNVMRQSACLVFNPIMVDNYAAFFNCTPVGRASDSMMAPT